MEIRHSSHLFDMKRLRRRHPPKAGRHDAGADEVSGSRSRSRAAAQRAFSERKGNIIKLSYVQAAIFSI
jgi:hypothetical protein